MPKYCPDCGRRLKDNPKFCPECGKRIMDKKPESEEGREKSYEQKNMDELIDKILQSKNKKSEGRNRLKGKKNKSGVFNKLLSSEGNKRNKRFGAFLSVFLLLTIFFIGVIFQNEVFRVITFIAIFLIFVYFLLKKYGIYSESIFSLPPSSALLQIILHTFIFTAFPFILLISIILIYAWSLPGIGAVLMFLPIATLLFFILFTTLTVIYFLKKDYSKKAETISDTKRRKKSVFSFGNFFKKDYVKGRKSILVASLIIMLLVIAFLAIDVDGDGLNNISEIQEGTSFFSSDSDGDGLGDGEEIDHGTDATEIDSDSDLLWDGEEVNKYGTDPLDDDTDSDGIGDYEEINSHNTDALNSDSDNDGLNDYAEINNYGTEPLDDDTDDDGLLDGEEVEGETDVFDADTDDDGNKDGSDSNPTTHDWKLMDSDDDGWSDYREYYEEDTDRFDSDSDNDGAPDGHDAHPMSKAKKTRKYYEWEYPKRKTWSQEMYVSYDLYVYESQIDRIRSWSKWSEYTLDPTAEQFAQTLQEKANREDFNYYQTVNFVMRFVQSMAYTKDDVTTGADEYPRYPLETLYEDGGDCEDTSILLSSIFRELNYDTCLVAIPHPGHMMVGVRGHDDYQGSYWKKNGKKYYTCETTGGEWKMGEIPSAVSSSKAKLYNVEPSNPITPPSPNRQPTVSIDASSTSGPKPLTVSFSADADDPDGEIVSYTWDFDDGTASSKKNPSHTFNEEGSFTVTLTVSDNYGASATDSIKINVKKPSTISLTATDDTYVSSKEPSKNHGGSDSLYCWHIWGFDNVYLKFDLSELPSGVTIKNAKLKLYHFGVDNYDSANVQVYIGNNSYWDESSITWDNAPGYASSYEDKIFIDSYSGWSSWGVTECVKNQNSGEITFVLRTPTNDGAVSFYSKEVDWNEKPPTLEVDVEY